MDEALQGLKVLIVDDEPGLRDVIAEFLETLGCNVRKASSMKEAESVLGIDPLDVLITDIDLDGEHGEELAMRLRAADPKLKLVFISGRSEAEHRLSEEPDSWFLLKPFRLEHLRLVLTSLWKQRLSDSVSAPTDR